eukprot:jgi/Bigna1/70195/fgenesh1_pg.11_\
MSPSSRRPTYQLSVPPQKILLPRSGLGAEAPVPQSKDERKGNKISDVCSINTKHFPMQPPPLEFRSHLARGFKDDFQDFRRNTCKDRPACLHQIWNLQLRWCFGAVEGLGIVRFAQKVLALYRSFLVAARQKPELDRQPWIETIRSAFKDGAQVKRNNFKKIEYLLRQGNKRLQTFKDSSVKSMRTYGVNSSPVSKD